jgi:hypothetical protein
MTTTNTRNTARTHMTESEQKVMALMQHLGKPYFISSGQLYHGTEEEACQSYIEYGVPFQTLDEYVEAEFEPVDFGPNAIEGEGYTVCTAEAQEQCKDVIGTERINDTIYFICKRNLTSNQAPVISDYVFDRKILDKLSTKTPSYTIGIDKDDKKGLAYCLVANIDGKFNVILCKNMHNETEFDIEVGNLSKYFNARIISSN